MILFCHKLIKYNYMFDIILFNDFMLRQSITFTSFGWFFCLILVWGIKVPGIRYGFAAFALVLLCRVSATKLSTHNPHLIWCQLSS